MAQVVIPDETLLRAPELWVPGRKPVGPVKIDWSHPLAHGLSAAYIPSLNHRCDLVTGAAISPSNAGITFSHDALEFSGNHNGVEISPVNVAINESFTELIIYNLSAYGCLVGDSTAAYQYHIWIYTSTQSYVRIPSSNGDYYKTNFNPALNTDNTMVVVRNSATGNYIDVYGNGQYVDTSSIVLNGACAFNWLGAATDGDYDIAGKIYAYYVWPGRVLAAAEIASITADPYQVLRPA